jgi:hypothetical protein
MSDKKAQADPKLIREARKQDREAEARALLHGASAPAAVRYRDGVVHHWDGGPRWSVPATCPECGARVEFGLGHTLTPVVVLAIGRRDATAELPEPLAAR